MARLKKLPAPRNPLQRIRDWIAAPPYYGVPWLVLFYVALSSVVSAHGGIYQGLIAGFDDPVRMTQVLDWVNGAGWYDRTITRVDAPDGFTTIWSRLVDIPIAFVILAAQLFTGQKTAALVAAIVVPFAELAVLFAAARYFARPITGRKEARLIILFLMFTSVMNYKSFSVSGFYLGEASHHPWYVILNVVMFGAAARLALGVSGPAPALTMGFAITLLLAVGIEGFPVIAGVIAVLALLAWHYRRPLLARRVAQAALAGAAGSLLLLPMHQPPAHVFDVSFAEPSILGPILMGCAAAFLGLEAIIIGRCRARKILSLVLIIAVAALLGGMLIALFPQILDGPAAALTPEERAMALRQHAEAWPLYRAASDRVDYIGLAMPTAIALIAGLAAIATASAPRRRAMFIAYFGFAFITGGMAEWVARFYHHAMTSACALLLWAWQQIRTALGRANYIPAILAFVALGPFWMLLLPAMNEGAPLVEGVLLYPARLQTLPDTCNLVKFGAYLDSHYGKDTNLLVPGVDSSRLLYYSGLHIDFLNNYPSHNKFIDNEAFFATQDDTVAKAIAFRHKVDLVAICQIIVLHPQPLKPGERPMMFERLEQGDHPAWLKRVDTGFEGYKLYKVDKAALLK